MAVASAVVHGACRFVAASLAAAASEHFGRNTGLSMDRRIAYQAIAVVLVVDVHIVAADNTFRSCNRRELVTAVEAQDSESAKVQKVQRYICYFLFK